MRGMDEPKTCDRCGSDKLISGNITRASFVPKEGLRSFLSEGAGLEAVACLTCGSVSFWADVPGIKEMLTNPPACPG